MKKWKRLLVSLLTVSMTLGASTMSVMADDTTPYTYKVTLSAGNKGTINGQNKIEQANIAPDSTVTFNLNDIQVTDDKYYVKGIRLSGRDNASSELLNTPGFIVKGDADYVVAYVIKGNMVASKIMEASADIIFAFRGSSEWFAQPGLEEILFLARPNNLIFKKRQPHPSPGDKTVLLNILI